MNNRREVSFDTDRGRGNYVIEVLNSGACSYILPASIVYSDNGKLVVFNTEGYSKLKNCRNLSAHNVLSIVSLVISTMEACKDYLIYPDMYQLNVDMIYIDGKMEKVKLLYSPAEEITEENFNCNTMEGLKELSNRSETGQIVNLIGQLKMQCTSGGMIYLETLEDLICKEGMKFGAVLGLIDSLKEEAQLCEV